MTMTDPIADMLTRLRNANSAYHDTVGMPYSKIKSHIAEILEREGYIASWRVEDAEVGKDLVITLKFGNARERSIAGLKRVSKPGLRVYARKDNLPRVLGGLGIAIISTSAGLMTDKQANKRGVGGEGLAYGWGGDGDVTNGTAARGDLRGRRRHSRRPRGERQGPQGHAGPGAHPAHRDHPGQRHTEGDQAQRRGQGARAARPVADS